MWFIVGIVLGFWLISKINPKATPGLNGPLVIEKKACPPHKWGFQDIIDQNGEKQGERIVCAVCGPLNYSGRE